MQILPWLSYSVPGVLNLASFTVETGTALWCFLLCVIVDPGRCVIVDVLAATSTYVQSLVCCLASQIQQSPDSACSPEAQGLIRNPQPVLCSTPSGGPPGLIELASCRVPDDYQPDLEANGVVQVKRKVSSACRSTASAPLLFPFRKAMYQQALSTRKRQMSHSSGPDIAGMVEPDAPDAPARNFRRREIHGYPNRILITSCAGRRGAVLPEVLQIEAAADAPLQSVQEVCAQV